MEKIDAMEPVGEVISEWEEEVRVIKIRPEYLPATQRMAEHGYFWILSWFHKANRSLLKMHFTAIDKTYGVFGVRTPGRPNPIALSLVKLVRVAGDEIHVTGLDAAQGTPVLDIKPYFEADIVFSPPTPHMHMHSNDEVFRKQALAHHGEVCQGLELAVKMALLAEKHFGQIQAPDLKLVITGDPCLADVLQGLTRARLANPGRLIYKGEAEKTEVIWQKNGRTMHVTVPSELSIDEIKQKDGETLFAVKIL